MSNELEKEIVNSADEGCCGGPTSSDVDACCVADDQNQGGTAIICGSPITYFHTWGVKVLTVKLILQILFVFQISALP